MRAFALTLALTAIGCALPVPEGALVEETEASSSRVFDLDEMAIEPSTEAFSFVVDADGPQVVLASLFAGDAMTVGETQWARAPWLTPELALRRDVNIDAVPLELLLRQGQPFVTHDAEGEACVGYLGELSVVRLIMQHNVSEIDADLTDEELDDIWDETRVGPPESERFSDPELIWDIAAGREFLVARWETDDDCVAGAWGGNPEQSPLPYSRVPAEAYIEEARARFREHPKYDEVQESYDDWRSGWVSGSADDWPIGPWEDAFFAVSAFEAPDGQRLVLASAEQTYGCEAGPGVLNIFFDVAADGSLHHRQETKMLPMHPLTAVLEQADGELLLLTDDNLVTTSEHEYLEYAASIEPIQVGCGC